MTAEASNAPCRSSPALYHDQCPSGVPAGAGRGRRRPGGLRRRRGARARPHAAGRPARPADRRRSTTRRTARACTQGAIPRIGGLAIVAGILVPTRDLRRPRRAVPRDLHRHAAASPRSGSSTTSAASRPSREAARRRRDRADPRRRLRRDASTTSTLPVHRRLRPRLGRLPADDPVDRAAREPRQPDRRDGRAGRRASSRSRRRRSRSSPPPSAAPTPRCWRRSCAARRSPSCFHNYHPAKIFMGDSGALALGFLLAALVGRGRAQDRRDDRARRRRCSCSPCRSSTRRSWSLKRLKYRRAPWGADHNHFYHRFMRIGFSQRRTAAYLHLWAAMLAGLRDAGRASCRRARTATGTSATRCCWPGSACS